MTVVITLLVCPAIVEGDRLEPPDVMSGTICKHLIVIAMTIGLETNTKAGFHKWDSCHYLLTMIVMK